MKVRVFIRLVMIILSSLILVACDTNQKDIIRINGEVNYILEVGETFTDEGVTHPDQYILVLNGEVDSNKIGTYEIKYSIFTDGGELVKELFRFVNVIDSQKPIYNEKNQSTFYAGFKYSIDDFLESYSDNYDAKNSLIIEPSDDFIFNEEGMQEVKIKISDTSGNETTYNKTVNVVLEFERLIDYVYKNQIYKVSKGETGIGSSYVRVTIDSNTSFSYFDSGSIHFLKNFTSNLGTRASIQISGTYGNLDEARLNYHVSGTGSEYSVGFITFNAAEDYDTLSFSSFRSSINNLNLNEKDMIDEMNPRVLNVLIEFKDYVEQTLGVIFK